MPHSSKTPHCRRRTLPGRLKLAIILRQDGRCTDCGTRLVVGNFVFDHRPPLALRDVCADANDPKLVAAICSPCDKHKTRDDLRDIASAKRGGYTYNRLSTLEPLNAVRRGSPGFIDVPPVNGDTHPPKAQQAIREARERWAREQRGLRSWPPFSKTDRT